MPTLYVTETASRLEKEYDRILVTKHDEVLMRLPLRRIDQVVLVGNVGATTAALTMLIDADIPLMFINRSGKLRARLLTPTTPNLPLRQRQYARNKDSTFCHAFATAIVKGKIANQRTYALRLARRRPITDKKPLATLKQAGIDATKATDLATLMGIEGAAGRAYFALYRQSFGDDWQFNRRTRRPPRDPINAVLSLGYSMLTQAMMTALESAGLDPYLAYFHSEKYGRPALALDLLEEFRTPIIDSLTLTLLNHRILQPTDFEPGSTPNSIVLTRSALNRFFQHYSRKLDATFYSRQLGRKITYRKMFEVQARQLAHFIQDKRPKYTPFRLR